MRMIIKTGLLLVVIAIATIGVVSADSHGISGTWVGDAGGALMTHELDLAADTDATLTLDHWPCVTGDALTFEVWNTDGLVAQSGESTACSQSASFNTGAGGAATLKMYNHLTGVGSWYNLTAEGIELPGATAMVVEEEEGEAVEAEAEDMDEDADEDAVEDADEDADEDMDEDADEDMDEDADADMVEDAEAAAPAPVAGMLADGATLLGNSGGAQADYMLDTVAGTTYDVNMTYGTDQGGKFTGIGFRVYGPEGLVATGARPDLHNNDTFNASFTAGEGPYKVQVYNYHHGLTLFHSLEAMAAE